MERILVVVELMRVRSTLSPPLPPRAGGAAGGKGGSLTSAADATLVPTAMPEAPALMGTASFASSASAPGRGRRLAC